VIGKALRGRGVAGLVRYLYGPGKANEHVDPRLVAAWDSDLAALEPTARAEHRGGRDFRALVSRLNEPVVAAGLSPEDRPVYHLIVAAAKADPARGLPADRHLPDAEWGQIARDYMHRTGLAPRDDPDGVRWIAVRHDEAHVHQHIHIVATLARQDGRRCWPKNDFYRIGEASRAAEARYGLRATAPSDRTSAPRPTRAETEKATRTGRRETERDQLRRLVRAAAAGARDQEAFWAQLRRDKVQVKVRRSTRDPNTITGYSVALTPTARNPAEPVWFSGGKLAADLTLPKLQTRWNTPAAGQVRDQAGAVRFGIQRWATITAAATDATTHLQSAHLGPTTDGAPAASSAPVGAGTRAPAAGGAADVTVASGEFVAAAARYLDGPQGGPASRAADDYARATRQPWGRLPTARTPAGQALRVSATLLSASRSPRHNEARQVQEFLAALVRLARATAALLEAQDRREQAQAALRAAQGLQQARPHYQRVINASFLAAQDPSRTTSPTLTRPPTHRRDHDRGGGYSR